MKPKMFVLFACLIVFVSGCSNNEQKALKSFEPIVSHLAGLKIPDGKAKCSNLSYNVNKTDSLVSPFAGVITFKIGERITFTCRFAQQDSKWVHKSIDTEVDYAGEDSQNDLPRREFFESLAEIHKNSLDKTLASFLKCSRIYN